MNVVGTNFQDFIPEPFNAGHEQIILRFIKVSREASPDTAFRTFMFHKSGLAVRVQIFAKITLYNNETVLYAYFQPLPKKAMIYFNPNDGYIYGNTLEFSKYWGDEYMNYKFRSIYELYPNLQNVPIDELNGYTY
jgi:hypothetical protein